MKHKSHPQNFIYGTHAVLAALRNPKRTCQYLLFSKSVAPEIESAIRDHPDLDIRSVDNIELDRLVGEQSVHQGIVLKASPLTQPYIEDILADVPDTACIIVLDQVTDPHNIGAIMRSAAAFGAIAVVQQELNAPDANNSTIAKTASGAVEEIPLVSVTNIARTMEDLKKIGFWCIGLDEMGKEKLDKANLKGKIAFIMGREGKGLRPLIRGTCDILSHLPTSESFSTLNVSNAAAVSLYEWRRQNGTR
ncbi:MAG: 23S rRNA (guanosine(2251)-2'-O)-methyltransferase RlmB [Alphaproteobacteria bacterium]|nr:23S rRNA (guanosine(2251)-2'-O)-methyltransferase RlmB [Alphaproteobacteria bacterium]